MKPRLVHAQGNVKPLYVDSYGARCGDIRHDGVAFRFGDHGGWVVPLEELRAIVAEADAHRAAGPEICSECKGPIDDDSQCRCDEVSP